MHSTAQKIITDAINNEISTAIVMNNVAEDVSPLLLVGDEVTAGTIVTESFEVDCVVRVIISFVVTPEEKSLEILFDSIITDVVAIKVSVTVLFISNGIVVAGEIAVVVGETEMYNNNKFILT